MLTNKDIKDLTSDMSLEEKLSQLFIVGYQGIKPPDLLIDWLKQGLGGVILFRQNMNDFRDAQKTIQYLKNCAKTGLFVSVDQEGGLVERINGLPQIPTQMALAATGDIKALKTAYTILLEDLKKIGFNLNFSPVLDVNTEAKNPIIGIRAFSDMPDIVTKYGLETIQMHRDLNIIPVAKHFPGHGAAIVDSHLDLPVLDLDLETLSATHLPPFMAAIKDNVEMMMVCHIYFNALAENKNLPASLSKNIITTLLREKLDYKGLIITDDLEMEAILKTHTVEETATLAINAGVDILLYRNCETAKKAYNHLLQEFKSGNLDENLLESSVGRILTLKERYNILNADVISTLTEWEIEKNNLKAQKLFDKSLTIYKNPENFSAIEDFSDWIIVSVDRASLTHYKSEPELFLKELLPCLNELLIPLNPTIEEYENALRLVNAHKKVIIVSYHAILNSMQASLWQKIAQTKETYTLIAGNPFDLQYIETSKFIALSYGYSNNALRSFAKALKGGISGNQNLPVKLP